ncbi:hypothetical protein ADUPG1_006328, partial [Aduncisulcus paluster]
MRERDREEIFATRWEDDPDAVARDASATGAMHWCAYRDSKPVAVFGVQPRWPKVWTAWAFATDEWRGVIGAVTRHSRRFVLPALYNAGAIRVDCLSMATHTDARNWLEYLGATPEKTFANWGKNGEDFVSYSKETLVCGSKPKVDNSAAEAAAAEAKAARQKEEQRQARINAGMSNIDAVFGSGGSVVDPSKLVGSGAAYDPNATYYLADGTQWSPTKYAATQPAPNAGGTTGGFGNIFNGGLNIPQGDNVGQAAGNVLGSVLGSIFSGFGQKKDNKAATGAWNKEWQDAIGKGLFTGTKTVSGFDQSYFDNVKSDYMDYYQPQLDKQFGTATDNLTFALARAGTLNSSIAGQKQADLTTRYTDNLASLLSQASGAADDARNKLNSEKSSMISLLNSTGNADMVGNEALARTQMLQNQRPTYNPIGDVFGGAAMGVGQYLQNQQNRSIAGGAYYQGQTQANYVDAVNKANRQAYDVSKAAREAEQARQDQFSQRSQQSFGDALNNMSSDKATADQNQGADQFAADLVAAEKPTAGEQGFLLPGQGESSVAVKDWIAREANTQAQDASRRIKALANMTGRGSAQDQRLGNMMGAQDQINVTNNLRRGSLGASQLEQNIPAAQVTPGSGTLGALLSGAGMLLGSGALGGASVMVWTDLMNSTVNTNAIAQGFGALAKALAPDYNGMIQADLAGYRRDNIAADTGYRNALTGKVGLESDRLKADNTAVAAARAAIASGLTDPQSLGAIFAGAYGDAGTMNAAGGFSTAYQSSVNPDFVNSPNFSGVLAGTGVQTYQNTPQGQANSLASTLAVQQSANDGAVATQESRNAGALGLQQDQQQFALEHPGVALPGKSGANPGKVSVLDVKRMAEDPTTKNIIDKAAPGPLSEAARSAVLTRASQIYQQTNNWLAAVQQATDEFTYTEGSTDAPGWFTGNLYEATPGAPTGATLPAGSNPPADNPAPANPVAPAGASGGGSNVAYEGQRARAPDGSIYVQESGGNPNAVSPVGAVGLMQIMPATAANPGFGVAPLSADQLRDPAANRAFGESYMQAMLNRYGGDQAKALAAYNWGAGNADNWNGNMAALPAETRGYINAILGGTGGAPVASAPGAPAPQQGQPAPQIGDLLGPPPGMGQMAPGMGQMAPMGRASASAAPNSFAALIADVEREQQAQQLQSMLDAPGGVPLPDGFQMIDAPQPGGVPLPDGFQMLDAPAPVAPAAPAVPAPAEGPGFFDTLGNAVVRGKNNYLDQTANIAGYMTGAMDPAQTARAILKDLSEAQAHPMSDGGARAMQSMQERGQSEGWRGTLSAALEHPLDTASGVGQVAVEALTALPAQMAAMTAGAAGGSAVGGPVGGVLGGAAGMGLTSGAMEFASGIVGGLQQAGVPLTEENVTALLSDPEFMAEVKKRAATGGAIVGGFDALTAGVAGRLFGPVRRMAEPATGKIQLANDGQITNPADVLVEALAEVPGAAVEVPGTYAAIKAGEGSKADVQGKKVASAIDQQVNANPLPDAPALVPETAQTQPLPQSGVQLPDGFTLMPEPAQPTPQEAVKPVEQPAPAPVEPASGKEQVASTAPQPEPQPAEGDLPDPAMPPLGQEDTPAPQAETPATPDAPPMDAGHATPDFADANGLDVPKDNRDRGVTDGTYTVNGHWALRNDLVPDTSQRRMTHVANEGDAGAPSAGAIGRIMNNVPDRLDRAQPISWRIAATDPEANSTDAQRVVGVLPDGKPVAVRGSDFGYLVNRAGFTLAANADGKAVGVYDSNGERVGLVQPVRTGREERPGYLANLPEYDATVRPSRGPQNPTGTFAGGPKAPALKPGEGKAIDAKRAESVKTLDEAKAEIERRIAAGDETPVRAELSTPSGRKTAFTFPATEKGLENIKRVQREWKSKPRAVLADAAPGGLSADVATATPDATEQVTEQVSKSKGTRGPRGGMTPRTREVSFSTKAATDRAAFVDAGMTPEEGILAKPPRKRDELAHVLWNRFRILVNFPGGKDKIAVLDAVDQMLDAHRNIRFMLHALQLPEKAISLGGTLSLSLERFRGKYLGAYAHGTQTIHMPGRSNSFAHEWMHALDHYLRDKLTPNATGDLLSQVARGEGLDVNGSVEAAYVDLIHTMFFDEDALAVKMLDLE